MKKSLKFSLTTGGSQFKIKFINFDINIEYIMFTHMCICFFSVYFRPQRNMFLLIQI